MLSLLDTWLAIVLAVCATIFRFARTDIDHDMPYVLALLVALALSTYTQTLFGLDGEAGFTRYQLFPLKGWQVLAVKDAAFLFFVLALTLPLAPMVGLSAGFMALAMGHMSSVRRVGVVHRWRFTEGSSVGFGIQQSLALMIAGVLTFRLTPWILAASAVAFAFSLWFHSRSLKA